MKKNLIVFFIFLTCTLLASGTQPIGLGTPENPYQISNYDNLLWLGSTTSVWGKHFVQTANIGAEASQGTATENVFIPIGNQNYSFTGNYDGQNYNISNLYIEYIDSDTPLGMFGRIRSAELKNINLISSNLKAAMPETSFRSKSGLLVGESENSTIDNCNATGKITSAGISGGLVGYLINSTLKNSKTRIVAGSAAKAALVGFCLKSSIIGCSTSGNNLASRTVEVYSDYNNSYYWCGLKTSLVADVCIESTIANCYSTCMVFNEFDDDESLGKFIEFGFATSVINSYYNYQASTNPNKWRLNEFAINNNMFNDWLNNNLELDINDYFEYNNGYYLIDTEETLTNVLPFANDSLKFMIMNDLDLRNHKDFQFYKFKGELEGNNKAIRNLSITKSKQNETAFICNANNSKIKNLTLNNVNVAGYFDTGSLIGMATNTEVENCIVQGSVMGDYSVGGLIARSKQTKISNCHVSGHISGNNVIGGLVAVVTDSTEVKKSSYEGVVMGSYNIGGLIGEASYSTIEESYSNANIYSLNQVELNQRIGGLLGFTWDVTVKESFAKGSIQTRAGAAIGGFIGIQENSWGDNTIENCYSTVNILTEASCSGFIGEASIWGNSGNIPSVKNCYYAGRINTANDEVHGFSNDCDDFIDSCFWDMQVSGINESEAGIGLTTAEMQNLQIYLDAGWDFENETENGTDDVWSFNPEVNNSYPYLAFENDLITDIEDNTNNAVVKKVSYIEGNYPNPFNPTTTIKLNIAQNDKANLSIYNIKGQLVKSYKNLNHKTKTIVWQGKDRFGKSVASGVYFYRLKSKTSDSTKKMMLIK